MSRAGKKIITGIKAAKSGRGRAVKAELASALRVIWVRGDAESRTWVFLNFPGWARTAAINYTFSSDPYTEFVKAGA